MKRFLASFRRWSHAAMRVKTHGSGRIAARFDRAVHMRRLRLEALEDRSLLSVLFVDDSATGLNDGTSWDNAYIDLQSALSRAVAGDVVRVGQGIYKPTTTTNRTVSFQLKNGVSILGGYAGFGEADPDARDIGLYSTILSGNIGAPGSTADNSYHVVVGSGTDATAVMEGVTITAGNANDSTSNTYYGGGMYNSGGRPTLSNCMFTANSATYGGGGMYNNLSSPTLTNCTFTANSATGTNGYGGGMYNYSSSSPTLTNCTFTANSATGTNGRGGGMYNESSSSPTLTNCTFTGNSAKGTDAIGGGVYNNSSSPKLTNCILWANTASNGSQIYTYSGGPVVTYCDIQGGYSGTGNINLDPQFFRNPVPGPDATWGTADDDYGDLRLRPFSPVVDAGNNPAVPGGVATDLGGNPRFRDVPTVLDTGSGQAPLVDMGAYEAIPSLDVMTGGPYTVREGLDRMLQGHGASDQPGALIYEWDFDGDGQYDDAMGPNPIFSAAALRAPAALAIGLRLTDGASASITDATVIVIASAVTYVDDTAAGLSDGLSWENAYTSLQPALAGAVPGQIIRVAQGTYKPTSGSDRTASFALQSGVEVRGGYAGCTAPDPFAHDPTQYVTILSGDIGLLGYNDNSYHVVVGSSTDSTAVLDGVTITAGKANGTSSNAYGGGMYISSGSPTVTNCTFAANSAFEDGGGMYNKSTYSSSSPTLTNCTFIANSATDPHGCGGGMYNSFSSPTLINCTFTANSASFGGGMYNYTSSSPTLTNCILWANTAPANSQIYVGTGTPVVTYCDIQGGYSGTGNINMDPQFVRTPNPGPDGKWRTADDDYGDLRLRLISPCIDAGKNSAVPADITSDLAGNPRFVDVPGIVDTGSGQSPLVDMGPYEAWDSALALGGTDGPNNFSLSLTADQASVRIDLATESYIYAVSVITSLTLSGRAGDDRLTVDFTNGSPVPEGGVAFDGQDGTDTFHIAAPGSNATLTGTQVVVGTAAPIVFHGTEGISFDLGNGRLTKSGSGAAVLLGGSSYSGGTEVLEGTLVIGHAQGLPAGGALTIGAGGTVVLAAGLSGGGGSLAVAEVAMVEVAVQTAVLSDAEARAASLGELGKQVGDVAAPVRAIAGERTAARKSEAAAASSLGARREGLSARDPGWLDLVQCFGTRKRTPVAAAARAVDLALAALWR